LVRPLGDSNVEDGDVEALLLGEGERRGFVASFSHMKAALRQIKTHALAIERIVVYNKNGRTVNRFTHGLRC